jgi:hypothetical protein
MLFSSFLANLCSSDVDDDIPVDTANLLANRFVVVSPTKGSCSVGQKPFRNQRMQMCGGNRYLFVFL